VHKDLGHVIDINSHVVVPFPFPMFLFTEAGGKSSSVTMSPLTESTGKVAQENVIRQEDFQILNLISKTESPS
jgi:hypothetical protein